MNLTADKTPKMWHSHIILGHKMLCMLYCRIKTANFITEFCIYLYYKVVLILAYLAENERII